jgi:hypothetical protein
VRKPALPLCSFFALKGQENSIFSARLEKAAIAGCVLNVLKRQAKITFCCLLESKVAIQIFLGAIRLDFLPFKGLKTF